MMPWTRRWIFLVFAVALGAIFLGGVWGLAPFGHYPGPYGDVLNAVAIDERHLTNIVTAVNFDYRAFDTLGEENILFAAVAGTILLLRRMGGEKKPTQKEAAGKPQTGDAIRLIGLIIIALSIVFGIYIVMHAHLTPGGGFQGGAILGTACLMVYLVSEFEPFRRVSPRKLLEVADAGGAGLYAVIGFMGMICGGAFLQNVLSLGQTGQLASAGIIPLINFAVGLEVAGGFVLIFKEFIEQLHTPEGDPPSKAKSHASKPEKEQS